MKKKEFEKKKLVAKKKKKTILAEGPTKSGREVIAIFVVVDFEMIG
jgi:hypothetical protein